MPRLCNEDLPGSNLISEACEEHGFGSSFIDVCRHCAPRLIGKPFNGMTEYDEPVGIISEPCFGWAPYEDMFESGNAYKCEECGCTLRKRDH